MNEGRRHNRLLWTIDEGSDLLTGVGSSSVERSLRHGVCRILWYQLLTSQTFMVSGRGTDLIPDCDTTYNVSQRGTLV